MTRQLRALVALAEDPNSIQVQFLEPELTDSQSLVTPALGDLLAFSRIHG